MSIKTNLTNSILNRRLLLSVASVMTLSALPLMAVASEIYRCGPVGSQRYSQIPCEENSEKLVVEDHPMFNDPTSGDADVQADKGNVSNESARKAQAFINQLEKQRSEQLAEIDKNIQALQSAETPQDSEGEHALSEEKKSTTLAGLQTARSSIVSEYDAMIDAAMQRINTP